MQQYKIKISKITKHTLLIINALTIANLRPYDLYMQY